MRCLPLVSVIVPVYNVEQQIDRCVQSICSQSYDNLEILLIDDGSSDSSGSICDEWESKDSRIKVFHKINGGLSDARNYGIDRAAGELLMFVDSDDYIAADIVEVLYGLLVEHDAEISICDPVHVSEGESASFCHVEPAVVLNPYDAVKELLYQTSFLTAAWGKLYMASCFSKVRFPIGVLFEDSAIMYRVLERAHGVVYTPSRLYAYCHRKNSITTSAFDERHLYIWDICKQIESRYANDSADVRSAAQSYRMSTALRIYLNAPKAGFESEVSECEAWIRDHSLDVMRDSRVRRKTKFALLLFIACRPLMRFVYGFVDRWS